MALGLVVLTGSGAWLLKPGGTPANDAADLPVPRITQGQNSESCLAALADDPAGTGRLAEGLQAAGANEGAAH
ncbi:MAG TPA: hypothetical protein VIG49_09565, partial [Acetobacteraceae bacterium]